MQEEIELGKYIYLAITKVHVWSHGLINIRATAIHEYVYSYLVRGTLYGDFMRAIEWTNRKSYEHYSTEAKELKNLRMIE